MEYGVSAVRLKAPLKILAPMLQAAFTANVSF